MKRTLVAFSGLDGAGKTTQIELLLTALGRGKYRTRYIWTRVGYTPLLNWLKATLRRSHTGVLPPPGTSAKRDKQFGSPWVRRVWLTLSMLDLLLYLGLWVRCLRLCGFNVVADRWLEDSELDLQLNFPQEQAERWLLWRLVKFAVPTPQRHFLFLIPVEESLRRSIEKKEPFPDDHAVLSQRLACYLNQAEQNHVLRMDGLVAREILHHQVLEDCRITT